VKDVKSAIYMTLLVLVAAFFIGCMNEESPTSQTTIEDLQEKRIEPTQEKAVEALIETEAPDLGIDDLNMLDEEFDDEELENIEDDFVLGLE
jgi:PBP1b-binding outer membrane lipoprotein LpoB